MASEFDFSTDIITNAKCFFFVREFLEMEQHQSKLQYKRTLHGNPWLWTLAANISNEEKQFPSKP